MSFILNNLHDRCFFRFFLNNASTPNQGQNKWIKLKMTSVQLLDIADSWCCADEEETAASYEDKWSKIIPFDLLLKQEWQVLAEGHDSHSKFL